MHKSTFVSLALGAFALPLTATPTYTYTYTGNDFTTAVSPFTTSDSVSGSFTLSSPLGDNLSGANIASTVTAFSFSDIVDTITNTTPGVSTCACSPTINIWTNGSGVIINWEVSLTVGNLGSENILTEDYNGGIIIGNQIEDYGNHTNTGTVTASNTSDPGTWNVSVSGTGAPEPGSLVLLGLGLVIGAAVRRRRHEDLRSRRKS